MLLSHGADPNVQTARGNLTPLHLACGAGNDTIVETLVRHGCELNLHDCFGSSPCDHAIRNGFPSVAEFLEAQIAIRNASSTSRGNTPKKEGATRVETYEQDKFLLQSAFSNLSLKDKLIFNMMVRKRGRASLGSKQLNNPTIPEGNEDFNDGKEVDVNTGEDTEMKDLRDYSMSMKQVKGECEFEVDSVDSVLTDTDRESLDIAMKLMNTQVRNRQSLCEH